MKLIQTAMILIFIGTAGLLSNEFLFHWGRMATLLLACVSFLGYVILGVSLVLVKGAQVEEKP